MRSVLVEIVQSPVQILQEAKDNGGRMVVKAKVLEANIRNANNRVYRKDLVAREVKKLQERIRDKAAFGSGDHPADGRTSFDNITHVWSKVSLANNEVFGEAVILNTDRGRTLQEIIRVTGSVPVSARGFGRTSPGQWEGQPAEIVEDNYELVTFDFVLNNPGFEDAKVTSVTEQQTTREQNSAAVRHQQALAGLDPGAPPIGPLTAAQRQQALLAGLDVDPKHAGILKESRRTLSVRDELRHPFRQQHLAGLRGTDELIGSQLAEKQIDLHEGAEPIWSVLDQDPMLLEETPALPPDLLGLSVYAAVRAKFPSARPLELFADHAIVSEGGALLDIPFEVNDRMEVTLGPGQKVAIEYVPAVA